MRRIPNNRRGIRIYVRIREGEAMTIFGYTPVRSSELPFHREVNRLIRDNPDYLDGIRKGIVHVAFNPGQKPKEE